MKGKVAVLAISLLLFFTFFTLPVFANNNADTNNSAISVSSSSIPSDGSTTATISVTAKDSSGNMLSGDTISLSSSSDSGLVINGGNAGTDNANATTDSNGSVTFLVSSNNPGTDTFTASDTSDNPSVALGSNGSITVTFTSVTPTPTPATCTDNAPGSAPQLTSAVANGISQITLTWTDAIDPVSYYLLAYGTTSGNYIYGNPNVGGQGTTSYTVNNLATGTMYYFAVRAVNGCNSSNFSNEISATTNGGYIANTPTPAQMSADTSDQNLTPTDTPTDTPAPSQHVTTTPIPTKTLIAGFTITKVVEYLSVLIIAFGIIGGFIYWKHKRKPKKNETIKEENELGEKQENDEHKLQ